MYTLVFPVFTGYRSPPSLNTATFLSSVPNSSSASASAGSTLYLRIPFLSIWINPWLPISKVIFLILTFPSIVISVLWSSTLSKSFSGTSSPVVVIALIQKFALGKFLVRSDQPSPIFEKYD